MTRQRSSARLLALLRAPAAALLANAALLVANPPLCAQVSADRYPRRYEYQYAFNTADLNENHFIVLDSINGRLRGWYYGTSDEFDSAREGYLPGFFVAEMQDLSVSRDRISFSLEKPAQLFAAPVPHAYRSSAEIPAGTLKPWTVTLPSARRDYAGTVATGRIVLGMGRAERIFREVARR